MKILVTGAAGFIGSHTVDYLSSKRYKVLALDNFSSGKSENLKEFSGSIEHCDITNLSDMEVVFNKFRPDSVLHLAAQSAITTAWQNPEKDMEVNIAGTLNVVNLCRKYDVKKLVFSSTAAVYGKSKFFASSEKNVCNPDTPYGISKQSAEQYIRLFFPNHVILRYANIYGPRQTPIGENQVVARALSHLLKGDPFDIVGDGKQKRDFVYVGDVARANYFAITGEGTGTFNVASGKSHSVNEVLREIELYFDVPYRWTHTKENDKRGSVFMNGDKFRDKFGWSPICNLISGIDMTVQWWEGKK